METWKEKALEYQFAILRTSSIRDLLVAGWQVIYQSLKMSSKTLPKKKREVK